MERMRSKDGRDMSEYNEGTDYSDVDWKDTAITMQAEITRLTQELSKVGATVIEKAAPKVVLPTEVGFYLSRESKLWTLEVNGYWRDDDDYTKRPDEAEAHAPFTRLEPRAVTAKAVLDRLVDLWPMSGTVQSDYADVMTEFGVVSS